MEYMLLVFSLVGVNVNPFSLERFSRSGCATG